ncbi:MAG: DUF975 family protein [Clostridia bacterium]|nr:DUF975 family protein [Clostridia bacterium]
MKAKDYRQSAWKSLSGKWGVCVLAFLIFDLISAACAGGTYFGVGAVVGLIIMGPITLGASIIALNVARGKDAELGMLFKGFNDFTRSLVLYITNNILIALWTLLFFIPGIIKTFSYSMSYYILIDNPNLTANEARKKSMEMMKGNKWRLFCLQFSFIGWLLLSLLTFGILMFWVAPYMEVARAKFYMSLLPEEEVQDRVVDNGYVDIDGDLNSQVDAFSSENKSQNVDFKDDFDFSDNEDFK